MKLLKKIYDAVFSESGILLVPILIIIFIVSSSFGTIMSRLGFETKENVKIELNLLKQELDIANAEIKRLNGNKVIDQGRCDLEKDMISKLELTDSVVDKLVGSIIIGTNKETTENKVTEVVTDKQNLSSRNIDKIHLAYNSMFGV